MDTRLLKVFDAVAREGSMAEAAKALHLTPSALSHSLKALEEELGCELFTRAGKRLVLNNAGKQLLTQIQGPMAALENAAARIKAMAKDTTPRLRVGAAASTCRQIIPSVLKELRARFPTLEAQIETGDMDELVAGLRENRIDLAIGLEPTSESMLQIRNLFTDEILLVMSPMNPLANQRTITVQEICEQPFILYRRHSTTARSVLDYLRSAGVTPRLLMEVGSMEGIRELVRLNLGVSVVAPWMVSQELTKGHLCMRPLGPKPLKRRWVLAFLKGRTLTPVEEDFCQACGAQTSSMRMDRRDIPRRKRASSQEDV